MSAPGNFSFARALREHAFIQVPLLHLNEFRTAARERIKDALWRGEHLSQEHYLDIRLPALVAALEGLVSTGKRQVTKQFKNRVPELAKELGVPGVSEGLCQRMYDARSESYHGANIRLLRGGVAGSVAADVLKLQQVLRKTVKRSLKDLTFGEVFVDETSVRARWPVTDGEGNQL
jgi:hypothetical protein